MQSLHRASIITHCSTIYLQSTLIFGLNKQLKLRQAWIFTVKNLTPSNHQNTVGIIQQRGFFITSHKTTTYQRFLFVQRFSFFLVKTETSLLIAFRSTRSLLLQLNL